MPIIYHATVIGYALKIARTGAILSPLDKEMHFVKSLKPSLSDDRMEKKALHLLSNHFADHEIEHRVKCVSFEKTVARADLHHHNTPAQKIIFGLEFSIDELNSFLPAKNYEAANNFYVPRKAPLEGRLKQVYIKKRTGSNPTVLMSALEKYSANFLGYNRFNP